jgi:hypothetical protein
VDDSGQPLWQFQVIYHQHVSVRRQGFS